MQGAMEVDEEEQGIVIKEALKADSVAVLLGQALQAQDRALLERYAAAFQAAHLPMTTRLAVACKHQVLEEKAIIIMTCLISVAAQSAPCHSNLFSYLAGIWRLSEVMKCACQPS